MRLIFITILPWTILIQMLIPLYAVDIPSHRTHAHTHTHKHTFHFLVYISLLNKSKYNVLQ